MIVVGAYNGEMLHAVSAPVAKLVAVAVASVAAVAGFAPKDTSGPITQRLALHAPVLPHAIYLTAFHDGADVYRGLYANEGVADKPAYPSAEHPVVRTHPVTGKKALYVNRGFTRHIVGIPRDESDAMLAYLYQHCENPLFQCRFRWSENAIAFWDNRCAQHRAMWDYWPHTRAGTRVTVQGERPV